LIGGGAAGTGIYFLLLGGWFRRQVREAAAWLAENDLQNSPEPNADEQLATPSGEIS
jgi:hypothetical protein